MVFRDTKMPIVFSGVSGPLWNPLRSAEYCYVHRHFGIVFQSGVVGQGRYLPLVVQSESLARLAFPFTFSSHGSESSKAKAAQGSLN